MSVPLFFFSWGIVNYTWEAQGFEVIQFCSIFGVALREFLF